MTLEILTISETKKNGQGKICLRNDHILLYSGVPINQRAAAGVGNIIHKDLTKQITQWMAVSERILIVELRKKRNVRTNGPDENEKVEKKILELINSNCRRSKGNIIHCKGL